jgi:DNA-binding transcriptional MerR regulator
MDDGTLYSIGDLARRTGLTVKTVRFYADRGIVPPTDRSPAGYRRYDIDAVARLDLVRTLRDLGLDLATIRKVVDREVLLAEVAAAHAEALAVQIRTLRLRRAVLTAVAKRGSSTEEIALMHKLARLSEDERRRLIDDFLDAAFGGLDADPAFVGIMRSMTPQLPDNPEAEQVEAWVELAELAEDQTFRTSLRRMAEHLAAERTHSRRTVARPDFTAVVRDRVTPELAAGTDPTSQEADGVVDAVVAQYGHVFNRPDEVNLRRQLLTWMESVNDSRRERYMQLLSVVNGWPAPDSLAPVFDWFVRALRVRVPGQQRP